ncbi:MAG: NAD-dependent epimerase/dehydratase family protein [Alphaproteobacteria bacterium]
MARYVVTGGCGFIGSHVVEAILARGDTAIAFDDLSSGRPENLPAGTALIVGDVADPVAVGAAVAGVDGIFHLAGQVPTSSDAVAWRRNSLTNLTGTVTVLAAARDAGRIPVVFSSSAAVYGDSTLPPQSETARPAPLTAYGIDKLASEMHVAIAGRLYRVPSFTFRLFNIYGPRQSASAPYSSAVAAFAERMAGGQDVTIHGDGRQVRDFVFVTDAVEHLLAGLDAAHSSAPLANLCTGTGTSIVQLAETMRTVTGFTGRIVHGPPRVADIRESIGDPDFARQRLGLTAGTDLSTGLSRLLNRASRAP